MLPIFALLVALSVGLLLVVRIPTNGSRRVRSPFTKFLLDEGGQNYWDGEASRPIVSRYGAPTPARVSPLPSSALHTAIDTGVGANR